jgi:hypothetical protein
VDTLAIHLQEYAMLLSLILTAFLTLCLVLLPSAIPYRFRFGCNLVLARWLWRRFARKRWRPYGRRSTNDVAQPSQPQGFPHKKPDWVRDAVLALQERLELSHRKLADAFNQLYFAPTRISVGRTWVRQLLIKQAYDALHLHRELKHRVPPSMPINRVWGIDTTCVSDVSNTQHIVLGIVDHGSRLNLALRHLKRFNTWTFLGCVFLAIGQFGKPSAIKTDNHAVFHAKWVKRVLR